MQENRRVPGSDRTPVTLPDGPGQHKASARDRPQVIDTLSHLIFGSFGVFGEGEIPGSTEGGKAGPTARRGRGRFPEHLVGMRWPEPGRFRGFLIILGTLLGAKMSARVDLFTSRLRVRVLSIGINSF
jgi:hypothetical protein